MRSFWSTIYWEVILLLRSRLLWPIGLLMAFFGLWEAIGIRGLPTGMWTNFVLSSLWFVTLILTFWAGGQAEQAQARRVNNMIWSTPISSWTYIWGRFMGMLLVAFGFTLIYVCAAILTDQFWNVPTALPVIGQASFPPLGAFPYIIFWIWLVLVPTIFGVAFAISLVTLLRGKKIAVYIGALLLWIPLFLGIGSSLYGPFEITAANFFAPSAPNPYENQHFFDLNHQAEVSLHTRPYILSPELGRKVMDILRAEIPPTFLGWDFVENRIFFLILSIALLCLAAYIMERRRQTAGEREA
ncbi:MAG TPA: hypothetical protein VKV19_08150 [Ktedonobacteraceae bacterium]|nr:hypothetical protein [Ktedonobacteraceae bacterium]